MIKLYFKQAWQMLKENKLLSIISILGTAFAICMIMIIMILYEVNTANISPEIHRDRTYSLSIAEAIYKSNDQRYSYSSIGLPFIKECLYPLESAETVTAVMRNQQGKLLASTVDNHTESTVEALYTDAAFWSVFAFDFITGQPYDEAIIDGGTYTVIINETLARKLFGTTDVVGNEIKLDHIIYTIRGVVKDVSLYANKAYADVWIPYSAGGNTYAFADGIGGNFNCYILVSKGVDKKILEQEVANRVASFNAQTPDFRANIGSQPFTQTEVWLGGGGGAITIQNLSSIFLRYGIIIVLLLLVPALNLSGITFAQIRKRMSELGVRRSFGATTGDILWQVLTENLLLTLIGGAVGLVLSYAGLVIFRDWLLITSLGQSGLTGGMFSPVVFLIAIFFCLVMNLLSATVPAWRVSHASIVKSIREE
jgi:ABC-type antimicrobial peptide transport system permease subunit